MWLVQIIVESRSASLPARKMEIKQGIRTKINGDARVQEENVKGTTLSSHVLLDKYGIIHTHR